MHNINTKVNIMTVLIVRYVTQSEPNMHRYEQQNRSRATRVAIIQKYDAELMNYCYVCCSGTILLFM